MEPKSAQQGGNNQNKRRQNRRQQNEQVPVNATEQAATPVQAVAAPVAQDAAENNGNSEGRSNNRRRKRARVITVTNAIIATNAMSVQTAQCVPKM